PWWPSLEGRGRTASYATRRHRAGRSGRRSKGAGCNSAAPAPVARRRTRPKHGAPAPTGPGTTARGRQGTPPRHPPLRPPYPGGERAHVPAQVTNAARDLPLDVPADLADRRAVPDRHVAPFRRDRGKASTGRETAVGHCQVLSQLSGVRDHQPVVVLTPG